MRTWLNTYLGSGKSGLTWGGLVIPPLLVVLAVWWQYAVALVGAALIAWFLWSCFDRTVLLPRRLERYRRRCDEDDAAFLVRNGFPRPANWSRGFYP